MLARYWRVVNPKSEVNQGIRVCGIELWNSTTRVCQTSTLTSSIPPTSGTLSNLKDESFATECYFDNEVVKSNLILSWDAGSGNQLDVEFVRVRTADNSNEFLSSFLLQYSSDNANWDTLLILNVNFRLKYPGAYQITNMTSARLVYPTVIKKLTPFISLDETKTIANFNKIKFSFTVSTFTEFFARTGKYYIEALIGFRMCEIGGHPWMEWLPLSYPGAYNHSFCVYPDSSYIYYNGTNASYIPENNTGMALGKTIGIKMNIDAGTVAYIVDGVEKPTVDIGFGGKFMVFAIATNVNIGDTSDKTIEFNFGQKPFVYPIPSGYIAGFGPQYEVENIDNSRNVILTNDILHLYHPHQLDNTFVGTNFSEHHKIAFDPNFGGNGYIKNTVKIKGSPDVPVRRKVILFDFYSRVVVGETWSQEGTGLFEFKHLKMDREYFAMSVDHMGQWQMAAAGPMKPQKMTLV